MKSVTGVLAWTIGLWGWCACAHGQSLVPLGDMVDEPLLPTGISNDDVEMFGELVYLWNAEDGANVIHFVGDFELHLGARRLSARQAVIWISPRTHEDKRYNHFELVLSRDVKVVESAGTVTRGPLLFVTLDTVGKIRTSADQKSHDSSASTPAYQRAARIREAIIARIPAATEPEAAMTVLELGDAVETRELSTRPPISYHGRDMTIDEIDGRGIVTAIGDVYVFRGDALGDEALELRADAAVVYLAESSAEDDAGVTTGEERPGRTRLDGTDDDSEGVPLDVGTRVEAIYLEGDIVLTSGERMIRASRLYYDFTRDRALILDAVMRMFEPKRSVPIYLRAQEVRQLSARHFSALDAKLTTSEFFTPHYHLGAREVDLTDRTPRDAFMQPRPRALAGTFELRHTTFNVGGVPLFYWPYSKADVTATETSLQSVRAGYSDDFGTEFESRWDLFNVLGLEKPAGVNGSLLIDHFSKRGPAVGVNLDYETDDSFGLYRGYHIQDKGEDNLEGRFRDEEPDQTDRGRMTLRHRQYLPDDWQLTFELSYISDKNYLEEYDEPDFEEGKEQETLLYLKKQVDNWAFTSHLQIRHLDFVQTTERLPEFSFRLLGESLGDTVTLFSENRAGWARFRPADRELFQNLAAGGLDDGSGSVTRGDTRQELDMPFTLGDFKVVPFGSVRGTAWDDTVDSGGAGRAFGTYGLRSSTYASKVFPEARSDLLDINGLRHIVKADVTAWAAHSNRDSDELFPLDETVEQINEVDGASFGLRQRLQTKRGGPEHRRIEDVLTFDLEVGLFNDADGADYTNGFASYSRPENSITRNYANAAVQYRMNDTSSLISEMNYDLNDGEMDVFALTYAAERTPRLSYLIGYRHIGELNSHLLGMGLNYKISEKYSVAVREEFDLERGDTAEFDVGVIRKFPRWFVGVTFSLDKIEDDFGVSISAWPEGLPQAALGNRRFTGLATTTGIRPGS